MKRILLLSSLVLIGTGCVDVMMKAYDPSWETQKARKERHKAEQAANPTVILREHPPPTREQLAAANYGARPSQAYAENFGEVHIRVSLKDPESARISWSPLKQSWFKELHGKPCFAWLLSGSVNAKNSYGGYTGAKPWLFYFRGNSIVGYGWWHRFRQKSKMVYLELDNVDWNDGGQLTQTQNRPEPPAVPVKSLATESPWSRLGRGLGESAVRDLLGEPPEKSVSTTSTIWFYPDINGGYVLFKSDRVHSWKAP